MKTDKNTLFRAIGEIDEKYVSEILEEDEIEVVAEGEEYPAEAEENTEA